MQIGQDKTGMIAMNQSLKGFVEKGMIDEETALTYTTMGEELKKMLGMKGAA